MKQKLIKQKLNLIAQFNKNFILLKSNLKYQIVIKYYN